MELELEQVRVTLTKNPELLTALKARKQFKKDDKGKDFYPVIFNSAEIRFYPNQAIVLGKTVAECLVRSSYIIVGDSDLTGDMVPVIEALDGYNLNKFIEERPKCEYCDKDFQTSKALTHHMLITHKAQIEKDLIEEETTAGVKVVAVPPTVASA